MAEPSLSFFGFELSRKKQKELVSPIPPNKEDGAVVVAEGGVYGQYVDLDGSVRSDAELINRYRDMAQYPEVDTAIDDIINECIVADPKKEIVTLNLDKLNQPDNIKEAIQNEFKIILEKLQFNDLAYEIFRKWYVDGRLYYHFIIDSAAPEAGLQELRYIDPRKIRKIKKAKRKQIKGGATGSAATFIQDYDEFYIYNEKGFATRNSTVGVVDQNDAGIRIAKDSIALCSSGLTNINSDMVVGYLHKAIKPLNQLKSMEDSLVIYRISRAPERRIFYIDVGNLPKAKAEQYLRDIMTKFKNKLVYDSVTGEVRDDRKFMTMLEDFWLPRREGGRGTEITTLPGGQNLGQIEDIVYFQRKLYKSLNVPITRLDPEMAYNLGRATEITRDEIKFAKFITRLRNKFSVLFTKILEKQLVLKSVLTLEDFNWFKQYFLYEYAEDNHFAELKNSEILRDRIATLREASDFIGKYWSNTWVRRNILLQTDEDIMENNQEIAEESNMPQFTGMLGMTGDQQPIPTQQQTESPPASKKSSQPPKNGAEKRK